MNHVGDGVALHGAARAEGGQHREGGEDHRQPFPAKAPFDGIHGTAYDGAGLAPGTVLHRQQGLTVFGGDAEHAGEPAPEHRARAAQGDGGGHADDVAGADGGSQRGGQRAELADLALAALIRRKAQPDGLGNVALHQPQPDGQEQMGAEQHDQHRYTPDKIAARAHKRGEALHGILPLKITIF